MSSENLEGSDEMTKKYTKKVGELQDNVKERHPIRNGDKGNATNVGAIGSKIYYG
jgi:hypothetical protein